MCPPLSRELVADAVAPRAFAAAAARSGDPDLRALADIYAAYLEALARRGWHAPGEQARLAAIAVPQAALPPLLLVDGVQFIRAGEIELIAALAALTEVCVALDPRASDRSAWAVAALESAIPALHRESVSGGPGDTPAIEAFTTADDEAQLREVARSIKQRLVEEATLRPSDFAVVFRRVGPHLRSARRVFSEYGLPLDPAAGEPLAERPFGVWALRLLRLGARGWRLLDVLDTCASGFFDHARSGLTPGHLYRLRTLGRRNLLWSGLDALGQLPEAARAATAESGDERRALLLDAAEAWTRLLATLTPALDSEALRMPAQHAAVVDALLFGGGGNGGLARAVIEGSDAPFVESGALRAELTALRAVDEALGGELLTFAAFVDLLEARMQRPSTLIREAGGVLLAPMHTLHGLRFRHVYLAGLSEGEFPARARSGVLLGPEARTALAEAGLELPPEQHATEHELWQTAITRAAASTTLWRGRIDGGGRPAAASYYFTSTSRGTSTAIAAGAAPERAASTRELAVSLASRWPEEARRPTAMPAWDHVVREAAAIEQRRRSFTPAGRYEGQLAGLDVTDLVAPTVQWSASRLETYRACPFRFFARYGLHLGELDEEQAEADAATRGTVMHEMLHDALEPIAQAGRPLDKASLAEAIARLRDSGRQLWDSAPGRHAFGRAALWRYQAPTALADLEALLTREAEYAAQFGDMAVVGGERSFIGPLRGIEPPLILQATVDRVDAGDGIVQIVDYKTGRAITRKDLEEGRRLQLQLYALVAGDALGAGRLIAHYAFLRPDNKEWALDNSRAEDIGLIESAAEVASSVRSSVAGGAFDVDPELPECPTYCEARTLCRVNHFSRSKSWS